ncbi:hypothetical protein SZ64_10215 [Erythrobacter sp. SG61-1L]|uniref:TonB-dependent receptor n=1 Tax=Erythrobacter sp. SG61-1L TaxID=1603897 RepID=UPI0006C8FC7B|nr:TonB-dependent receptor [Erythrobacter sp. SG61-1L]KPL68457.1 hypothetical protein SZ64_10215 [Erythrobacter sp. SG61-1L]
MAQEAPQGEDGTHEAIVVTGNKSLTAATTDVKQESTGVVDSLTAAQIDLTPDFTLAEAAARIPGVFGTSFQGQPRFLSLRGLDARYNSVSIDGNKLFNSSENNRGSQLDIIPASLINQVDVIKATTPDIDENSIGGHIAVRTLRAFDGGKGTFLKGKVQYGVFDRDQGADDSTFSGRADAVGKFTFGPGRNFGAVLGLDVQQRASNEDYFNLADGLQTYEDGEGNRFEIPARGTARLERIYTTNRRNAAFGKLETRAVDDLYAFVGLNYFGVEDKQQSDRKRYFVDTRPDRVVEAEDGYAVGSRGSEAFQFSDNNRDIDTLMLSGGLDYRLGGGNDVIRLRASWTDVALREEFFISNKFEQMTDLRRPRSIDIRGDYPVFTVDPAVSNDPALYVNGDSTYEELVDMDDDVYALRAEFESNAYAGAEGFGFRMGGSFNRLDRTLDTVTTERSLDGVTYTFADNRPDVATVDFADPALGIDRTAYKAFFDTNAVVVRDEALNLGADYSLTEDAYAGFAMAVYNGAGYQIVGGVRAVKTDVDVDNYTIVDGVAAPNTFHTSYTSFLPSVHAAFDLAQDWKLRLSLTQTIGRPDFEAFAFGTRIINDGLSQTIVSGNPRLKPRLATNLDASAEYYFDGGEGLIAVGAFYKEIDNEQFSQTASAPNPLDPLGQSQIRTTTFSDNGSAKLFGVEISAFKEDFSFIHPVLEGLRLSANYTYIDAELNAVLDDGTPRTIQGLRNQPEQLFNAMASYQAGPVGASIAYNWQGRAFTGEFQTNPSDAGNPGLNDVFLDSIDRLDASVWLDVLDNFQLNLGAQNITGENQEVRTGLSSDLLRRAVVSGPSYWLGLKFKF